jgi:hypothetical protein
MRNIIFTALILLGGILLGQDEHPRYGTLVGSTSTGIGTSSQYGLAEWTIYMKGENLYQVGDSEVRVFELKSMTVIDENRVISLKAFDTKYKEYCRIFLFYDKIGRFESVAIMYDRVAFLKGIER